MSFEPGIWEVAVLALLREAPMHPYQMRRLLKERHKDEVLALKRGSLYHAITRLERAELIEVDGTSRDGRRPERTTYRIKPAGIATLLTRLRQIIATPRQESSEFMAAMSFLVHLSPEDALKWLPKRARHLEEMIFARTEGMGAAATFVDRINLVESEYLLVMLRAELRWVRWLEDAIACRKLRWNTEAQLKSAEAGRKAAATGLSSPVPKGEGPGAPSVESSSSRGQAGRNAAVTGPSSPVPKSEGPGAPSVESSSPRGQASRKATATGPASPVPKGEGPGAPSVESSSPSRGQAGRNAAARETE